MTEEAGNKTGTPAAGAAPGASQGPATTTERVAERAHEVVDQAARRLSEQEVRVREGAAAAEAKARAKAESLRAAAESGESELTTYVRAHPLKSLAMAFGAGYLLAALRR